MNKVSVFWFRRDLRFEDNVGFLEALKGEYPVLPVFIFDPEILGGLPKDDARVTFIYETLGQLRTSLINSHQSAIGIYHGNPVDIFRKLLQEYAVQGVYTNRDYEPYAKKRDAEIQGLLMQNKIPFRTFKDQVIFEKSEVVKENGDPYVVYTPYMRTWKAKYNSGELLKIHSTRNYPDNLLKGKDLPYVSLSGLGFKKSSIRVPDYDISPGLIQHYEATRNFPAKNSGTSRLGPHLRFGTVSVRKLIKKAVAEKNEVFWNELIWREFFMQILWHYPQTIRQAFKPKYDRIKWRNREDEFEKWKHGQTGYLLVDAGMRELNSTGYMHNRVRMLVASFLCKHLLIDWRWGEAYFAEKLLDYDLASNVGNWQWAAGSGVDAAPYFRIFNPMTQVDKFDRHREYIKRWVPEFMKPGYPEKMVDHALARKRCLDAYGEALK